MPLVFNVRESDREKEWIPKAGKRGPRKKILLVSASGKTSPFPHGDLLKELLRLKFPTWTIIDLAEIRAQKFYDLLGLYEAANVLVATDSAPLHLAYAVPTLPVVALTNDKPSLWHGSPWRPQHIFHCRYRMFVERSVEMLRAIELNGQRHLKTPWLNPGGSIQIVQAWNGCKKEGRAANETWANSHASGRWVPMLFEPGAAGRNSTSVFGDDKHLPFVKDIIRNACMMAGPNDWICLTSAATCFNGDITAAILDLKVPGYAHRTVDGKQLAMIDLFAFTKAWWLDHKKDYPDFTIGDNNWNRVLMELVKRTGGQELPLGTVYREGK